VSDGWHDGRHVNHWLEYRAEASTRHRLVLNWAHAPLSLHELVADRYFSILLQERVRQNAAFRVLGQKLLLLHAPLT